MAPCYFRETRTFTVSHWKGAPSNPYTYDEMADKFRRYAAHCMPLEAIDQVIRRVRLLEEERDMATPASLRPG